MIKISYPTTSLNIEGNAAQAAKTHRQQGVTLIELLVAITMMAILLAIGVPTFHTVIVSNRLTSQTNALIGALNMARSEAIKRYSLVVVAKTGANWKDGWNIFADLNADNNLDVNEPEIQRYGAIETGFSIRPTGPYVNRVVYRPDGRSSTPGHFDLCAPAADKDFREIIVADTGRIRTARPDETGNLIHAEYATACP